MSLSARDYLVDRFRTDAQVLRERADALDRGSSMPGPDAATSRRMAEACDDVITMLQAIATNGHADAVVESLLALVPLLEQRAQQQTLPPVRAVYAGAATRIREVRDAERQAGGAEEAP
jgi:hypothetical protein